MKAEDDVSISCYVPLQAGDLGLLHERLDDLVGGKQSLEARRQSRLRYGLTLGTEGRGWLDGSAHEYDALMGALKGVKREVDNMKQKYLSRGLFDEHGEPTIFGIRRTAFSRAKTKCILASEIRVCETPFVDPVSRDRLR